MHKIIYNLSKDANNIAEEVWFYICVLEVLVPCHLYVIYVFLVTMSNPLLELVDRIGYVLITGTIL